MCCKVQACLAVAPGICSPCPGEREHAEMEKPDVQDKREETQTGMQRKPRARNGSC